MRSGPEDGGDTISLKSMVQRRCFLAQPAARPGMPPRWFQCRRVWQRALVTLLGFLLVWGTGVPQAYAMAGIKGEIRLANAPAAAAAAGPYDTVDGFLQNIPRGYYGIRSVDQVKARLDKPDVALVDVREPGEYILGHIDGAINIPLRTLAQQLDQIPKDKEVIVYCSSGYRSGMAVMALHLLGYDNVEGFPPSYQGWIQAQ